MADLPAEQLSGPKATTALQKLLDIWWRICTREGKQIPKVIDDKGNTSGTTSVETEASWNPRNNQILRGKADQILANQKAMDAKLDRIITKLGA
jgi:hypothetical protein